MLTRSALFATVLVLAAACMGGVPGPGQTLAPGQTQQPGGQIPAGTDTCTLVTAAEMQAIWGVAMSSIKDDSGACTWTAVTGLPSVTTRFDPTDLPTAKAILGNDADVTVAGRPGVIGTLFGVLLYVQVGNVDLVIQTVLLEDNPDNRQKVIRTAEAALT